MNKRRLKPQNETVTNYWAQYYATDHCTLCGNSGRLDTSNATTAAGVSVGRKNWCICPNGQALRAHYRSVA